MLKQTTTLAFLISTVFLLQKSPLNAQTPFFNQVEVGGSVNYSTLHYASEGDVLNDMISYDFGFQVHALVNRELTNRFTLQTGLEFFFFTYNFDDFTTPQTGNNGELTGNIVRFSITESFSTSYLTVPVRVKYGISSNRSIYLIAGPEFSFKVRYSNGIEESSLISENGEFIETLSTQEYAVPELADNFLISGVAGLGYDLNPKIPIAVELKARHSITPYLGGDTYIDSWIRGFSFTVSYHL